MRLESLIPLPGCLLPSNSSFSLQNQAWGELHTQPKMIWHPTFPLWYDMFPVCKKENMDSMDRELPYPTGAK